MQPIITATLYLLTIIIPLIFSPVSYELFEFPKFIILLSGTLIITIAWMFHIIKNRDYKIFTPNFLSYSVLAVVLTQTLSTLFSIDPYTSFWGYYSRFHGGLLTTICYTIIYFAAAKWLNKESTQKIINISIYTALFIGVLAILEHYNYSLSCIIINYYGKLYSVANNLAFNLKWNNFYTNACWSAATNPTGRSFSLLGQPNWLAAYLIPNIFMAIYKGVSAIKTNSKIRFLNLSIFATLLFALLLTRSRSGFIGFSLGFITYWIILVKQFDYSRISQNLTKYVTLITLSVVLIGTPFTSNIFSFFTNSAAKNVIVAKSGTVLENGGTESGDIRKIVWTGALKLVPLHPILGTGPETFAYSYYWTRPMSHNLTSEWDYLYNKAHNEYLNFAATTGILGLLAYLSWHLAIFLTSFKTVPRTKKIIQTEGDQLRMLYPIIGASLVGFTITNFFGFSVVPVYFIMVIISGIPHADQSILEKYPKINSSEFTALCILCLIALLYPLRLFYADYLFSQGKDKLDKGNYILAIPLLERATSYRPSLDLFHNYLGESYANVAVTAFTSENKTDQQEVQKYISQAITEAKTTRKLNLVNLNDFKSRAKIFLTMAPIDTGFNAQGALEIENARSLAPTDPKLAYNLGLVYTRMNNLQKAEEQFREAIKMKPNYIEPYYALTLIYEQTKQVAKIKPLLVEAKSNLATYSAQLKEKMDKYID